MLKANIEHKLLSERFPSRPCFQRTVIILHRRCLVEMGVQDSLDSHSQLLDKRGRQKGPRSGG